MTACVARTVIVLGVLFGEITGGTAAVVVRVTVCTIVASSVASAYEIGNVCTTCRSYFSRFGLVSVATITVCSSSTE